MAIREIEGSPLAIIGRATNRAAQSNAESFRREISPPATVHIEGRGIYPPENEIRVNGSTRST